MDHVLNSMQPHFEVLLEWFVEEQRNGNHKNISDNPYYYEINTLINSMNILREYLGFDRVKLIDYF